MLFGMELKTFYQDQKWNILQDFSLEKNVQDEKLRDIIEVKINLKDFSDKIKKNKDKIDKIKIIKDDRCEIINYDEVKDIIEFVQL